MTALGQLCLRLPHLLKCSAAFSYTAGPHSGLLQGRRQPLTWLHLATLICYSIYMCPQQVAGIEEHLQQLQEEHLRSEEQRHLAVKRSAAVSCTFHVCSSHLQL